MSGSLNMFETNVSGGLSNLTDEQVRALYKGVLKEYALRLYKTGDIQVSFAAVVVVRNNKVDILKTEHIVKMRCLNIPTRDERDKRLPYGGC